MCLLADFYIYFGMNGTTLNVRRSSLQPTLVITYVLVLYQCVGPLLLSISRNAMISKGVRHSTVMSALVANQ